MPGYLHVNRSLLASADFSGSRSEASDEPDWNAIRLSLRTCYPPPPTLNGRDVLSGGLCQEPISALPRTSRCSI